MRSVCLVRVRAIVLVVTRARQRKVFTLLVEMRCNSFCIFCGQRQVDDGVVKARRSLGLATPPTDCGDLRGRFTLETATRTIEEARAEGCDELSLQGGEPTLFPDLVPLVRAAREMGFGFIGLVTNGRKLKDIGFTKALILAGLDAITFSVLGHDAATHDGLAIAPGSFDELVRGLRNAAAIARELGSPVTLNVNLIPSKATLGHFAAQVRELGAAGAHALSLHLVRFDGLASDPGVIERMAFDARTLTPALEDAWGAADDAKVGFHATDVPLCLHPALRASELDLLGRRAAVREHRFAAASFGYDMDLTGRGASIACDGCLLARVCPRVPREYLPGHPTEVLHPITSASLDAGSSALLREVDPDGLASLRRVRDRKSSILSLARIAGDGAELGPVVARLDEALLDLAARAFSRSDAASLVLAFAARLGVELPPLAPDAVLRVSARATRDLAREARAVPAGREGDAWRLVLAEGFEMMFAGAREEDGAMSVTSVRPVHRRPRGHGDRVVLALFLGALFPALRAVRRVRLVPKSVDVDRGEGWESALRLDPVSAARWVRGSPASTKS
jgi:pyruvate-formate lyase-activating enzyme